MANFNSPEGDIAQIYLSDTEILERYVGNQLWGFGTGENGRLGENLPVHRSSPVQTIAGGTNWKQVSAGGRSTAAIKTDGTLWLWGHNFDGQLGQNITAHRSSPVQTIAGGTNWKQVDAGEFHVLAIKTDGTLWSWGEGDDGKLGTNTVANRSSPTQVGANTNWKQVGAGANHTAAIKTDGTLWLWGINSIGQLGTNDVAARSSPVQTIAGGTNWKQVDAGNDFTAAIKTDGTLWTWGRNPNGQLGLNDIVHRSSPVQVGADTNWKQVFLGSANGANHMIATKTNGTLWLCGQNINGLLGDNTEIDRSSPVQTVSGGTNWKQSCGAYGHTAAIKTDGTLWVWGRGSSGALGTNDAVHRSSPVQTIAGGTNWKQVDAGGSFGFGTYMTAVTYTES